MVPTSPKLRTSVKLSTSLKLRTSLKLPISMNLPKSIKLRNSVKLPTLVKGPTSLKFPRSLKLPISIHTLYRNSVFFSEPASELRLFSVTYELPKRRRPRKSHYKTSLFLSIRRGSKKRRKARKRFEQDQITKGFQTNYRF